MSNRREERREVGGAAHVSSRSVGFLPSTFLTSSAASLPHSVGSLRVSITLSPYVTPLSQLGLSTVSHSCLATVSQSHSSAVGKGPPSSHSRPLRSAYGEDEREERRTSEPDDERSGREKRKVMRVGYERNEETHSHHFSRLSLVPSCHSLSLRLTSSFPFPYLSPLLPPAGEERGVRERG